MTSWNEIRRAATAFSKRWKNAFDEKSQAQSFLKELFAVFGAMLLLPEQKEGLKGVFGPKQKLLGELDFAYRTFKWHNEAKDNAAVRCVIIGFHAKSVEANFSAENGEQEKEARSSSQTPATSQTSKLCAKNYCQEISDAAQSILDASALYPTASLAELYDPLVMPPELVKAHARLDALVDKAYGRSFSSDADRVAHLFRLYAEKVEKWKGGKVEK